MTRPQGFSRQHCSHAVHGRRTAHKQPCLSSRDTVRKMIFHCTTENATREAHDPVNTTQIKVNITGYSWTSADSTCAEDVQSSTSCRTSRISKLGDRFLGITP